MITSFVGFWLVYTRVQFRQFFFMFSYRSNNIQPMTVKSFISWKEHLYLISAEQVVLRNYKSHVSFSFLLVCVLIVFYRWFGSTIKFCWWLYQNSIKTVFILSKSETFDEQLTTVYEWIWCNELSLHIPNAQYMIFTQRKKNANDIDLYINNVPLCDDIFGIQIDSHCT